MKELIPLYKLRNGKLIGKSFEIPFDFGIVSNEDGEYRIELFFESVELIENAYSSHQNEFIDFNLKVIATTEDNFIFEATSINFTSLPFSKKKGYFWCHGYIYVEKQKLQDKQPEKPSSYKELLYYVTLEGLKMQFTNFTEKKVWRDGEEITFQYSSGLNTCDHSIVCLTHHDIHTKMIWELDSKDDSTMVIRFPKAKYQYGYLHYEFWNEIKEDFIGLLSFLNGAQVQIRSEVTGEYMSVPEPDGHKSYLYSFKKINNLRYNDYIPISRYANRRKNIVSQVFSTNFEKYREWNNRLNLNDIVFYLCNAEQTVSMDERVFTQMIMLEKLSDAYIKSMNVQDERIMSDAEEETVKNSLEAALKQNKRLFGEHYDTVKSRILNFNYIKKSKTDEKLKALVEGANITITPKIEKLIRIVRNSTIHRGDIGGSPEERLDNFLQLDKLVRDIILNLIEYKGIVKDID